MPSYVDALERAGATVTDSEYFGSYQGEWFARVGDTVVTGSFGSCSGCDWIEAELGYGYGPEYDAHEEAVLTRIGSELLEGAITIGSPEWDKLTADQERSAEWDFDAKSILTWLHKQES